ncbi:hypothetical protein [Nocardioides sp. AE5]|uniref:hypothetical protein n=1 Tax=Nocardioides sp. AE5 TaxID=2962573 RepID=UPI00288273EC|nr:hypothetical protein [Nocardioides sp. AE5]MDT0203889.1 hypothetical protein [Nocardioides sp. AE5]
MNESKGACPSWCDGQNDPLIHQTAPTHIGRTIRAGSASAHIEQLDEDDRELGEDARFDVLASLWYGGNGAIGDLSAIDCRDIATVMVQVADEMDETARGHGIVYGEELP